jgi:large subunit ribosomal protein L24
MKFKKGDNIIVTTGKDKGKKGKIERTFSEDSRVLVPGLNLFKRHTKARGQKNPGGIIEKARPLPVGNIALVCPKCNQPTRIGFQLAGTDKHRICRKCKQLI